MSTVSREIQAFADQLDRMDKRIKRIYNGITIKGTVVEVDLEKQLAYVVTDDENDPIQLQPKSGWLPAVGDEVIISMNGSEPIAQETRHFVEGAMASANYIPGEQGWIITADGDVEFANGEFRGTVTAKMVRTAVDGPRVEMDSIAFKQGLRFYSGDDGEDQPAQIYTSSGETEGTFTIDPPKFSDVPAAAIVPRFKYGVARGVNGYSFLSVDADEVKFNGTSFNKPPMSVKRRIAAVNPSIASSTTASAAVVWDENIRVNDPISITLADATGTWSIHKVGVYMLYVTVASWQDGLSASDGNRSILAVINTTEVRTIDKRNRTFYGNTGSSGFTHIVVDDDSFPTTVQVKLMQYSTPAVNLAPIQIRGTLVRISD